MSLSNGSRSRDYLAFGFKRLHLDAGERLDAFDPEAAEIVLVPQMRGG